MEKIIDESTLRQAHGTDCTMDPAQRDQHFHSCYEVAPKSLINKIFLFNVVATPWQTPLPISSESSTLCKFTILFGVYMVNSSDCEDSANPS